MTDCTDFLKNPLFYCEHLKVTEDSKREIVETFSINRENAKSIEEYIKKQSFVDEQEGHARTFLVRDCLTNEIACFFSLKAGFVSADEAITSKGKKFNSIPGIELAEFAVNDKYREKHSEIQHIGTIVFSSFIYKLALQISKCLGAFFLYIFALNQPTLIDYYISLNFRNLSEEEKTNTAHFFTPRYNKNCVFMCQRLVDEKL